MNELFDTLSKDRWKSIGVRKRAGVLAPLFSVYSSDSIGIGDLDDLKVLIDWCRKTGNSILQLLPMNEIGATFCPYDAVSSFAIEPSYISLRSVPLSKNKSVSRKLSEMARNFPAGLQHVDYRIKGAKEKILLGMYVEEGGKFPDEFKKFVKDNRYWLDDFALFKALKAGQGGRPWYEWDGAYKDRNSAEAAVFEKNNADGILFQKWMQWIAAGQFASAREYAASKGVLIKGDLPILTSRDSADVWAHPGFFKLEFCAGAPPDMYCAKGQRWGMSTYNWDAIASDGYRYLKEKLAFAENFYDLVRIDHVVGLFRIWSISYKDPPENEGLNGVFDPRDENRWSEHGRRILSVMIENTDMLLCAEDLGMIPKACPETLKEFGMPGNDVQRWTKDWAKRHDFLPPDEYRLCSVTMLSTHDTTNWPAWWENEAGTVDEAVFIRKTLDRRIDYAGIQDRLFDTALSRHGRLRWLDSVDSTEKFVEILGRKREELADFIEMYENSYREKAKLWKLLNMEGPVNEKSSRGLVAAMLKNNLEARSVFCVNLLTDYLYLSGIIEGDPYDYRINRPGTVSKTNWSMTIPIPLEKLLEHKVSEEIKEIIVTSGRTGRELSGKTKRLK